MRKYPYIIASFLTSIFPLVLIAGHTVADIVISAIAVLFLIHSFTEKDWRWCKARWIQCIGAAWIYIVIRSLFAEIPIEALHQSVPFIRYFIFAASLGHWTLQSEENRRHFFLVLKCAVFFLAVDGLVQWHWGKDILLKNVFIQPDGNRRLTGPFTDKPILGIILTWVSFPVFLELIMSETGRFKKGFFLITGTMSILFITAIIALSGERMALLLTLGGWVLAILLLPVRKHYLVGLCVAGIMFLAALSFISPMMFERQIISTVGTLMYWQESPYGLLLTSDLHMAGQNPIFGIGTHHFRIICPALYPGNKDACNTHPHNIYLEWLIENGIIGLGLFLAFLASILHRCVKAWDRERMNPLFLGFLIAFVIRIWPLAPSTSFFSAWGSLPFWLIVGALVAYSARGEEQKS